ncbi:hypothetical protein [Anaerovibrio lipolyticus]|nr:hypothetical protein [Anaerovibrio lipolyticus]
MMPEVSSTEIHFLQVRVSIPTAFTIKSTLGCTNNRKEQALMFDVVDLDESCNEDLLESINVQQFSLSRIIFLKILRKIVTNDTIKEK